MPFDAGPPEEPDHTPEICPICGSLMRLHLQARILPGSWNGLGNILVSFSVIWLCDTCFHGSTP